jgi:hypothetical protein
LVNRTVEDGSKGKQRFLRTDLMRAIKAARDAGLDVSKSRISSQGEIEIEAGPPTAPDISPSELDRWLSKRS